MVTAFPRYGKDTKDILSPIPIKIRLEVLNSAIRQEKTLVLKRRNKLSLFIDYMYVCVENLKESKIIRSSK